MRDGWMPMPDRPPKTGKRGRRDLEHFHKCCSAADGGVREAVFLTFDFVSAQSQGFQTFSFAKASSKVKNPRSAPLHHFCQCSSDSELEMEDEWVRRKLQEPTSKHQKFQAPRISARTEFYLCKG